MNHNLDDRLTAYYQRFGNNHNRLRRELMQNLGAGADVAVESEIIAFGSAPKSRLIKALRIGGAIAAVLAVIIGLSIFIAPATTNDTQAVWANALENFRNIQSIHLRTTTPGKGGGSSVELWWRASGDYRMEFSNGVIIAKNDGQRYSYDPQVGKVKVMEESGPGLEMFLLGDLGELFSWKYSPAQNLISESKIVSSQEIDYKGAKCLKVRAQRQNDIFDYILDRDGSVFYEIIRYRSSNPHQAISHMQVYDINQDIPADKFVIKAK